MAFRTEGDPPELYHVMFSVPGLELHERRLRVRGLHRCDLYLHRDYPRRPPVATWLTPIFHPNILPPERNGGVCIGSWSAAESLADLCDRLAALISYRSINARDALNRDAAAWATRYRVAPGRSLEELVALPLEHEFGLTVGGVAA
ncbi:MAG: ubiquitin-conjugating enzyme E2 [Solirubrobacteraceae bacterium]